MSQSAEPVGDFPRMPRFAVKTNLLYDATTTFNLGVELRLSNALTLDVPVNYNPWTFSDNRKIKHVMVQPELRYWIREPFNGHFLGVNLQYAFYNVGNLPLAPGFREAMGYGDLANFRYQGSLYGAGISYGYHWMLARRLSLEATIGMGYAWLDSLCAWFGGFAFVGLDAAQVKARLLSLFLLLPGLMMVTTVPFPHLANRFLSGKKSFFVLVIAVLLAALVWYETRLMLFLCFNGYLAAGLAAAARNLLRGRPATVNYGAEAADGDDEP